MTPGGTEREIAALRAAGTEVEVRHSRLPLTVNLMDPAEVPATLALGRLQAAEDSARAGRLLGEPVTGGPERTPLRLYTAVDEHPALAWSWVEQQLRDAGTYWVVSNGPAHPSARPVWGIWHDAALHLSIGSPTVGAGLAARSARQRAPRQRHRRRDRRGCRDHRGRDSALLAAYDAKYDWHYDADTYGPFTRISPGVVKAWRAAGVAGRDSFQETGRWELGGQA